MQLGRMGKNVKPGRDIARAVFAQLEPIARRIAPKLDIPPIFIVGLPRVGSTLASILATRHLRCAYFSNLLMATPASPVLTAMLAGPRRAFGGTDDLANRFGETNCSQGPSQGYRFWNLHLGTSETPAPLDEARKAMMRQTIAALQGIAGGPFINKWQKNGLRIPFLADLFPGSVFIEITRDPLETALSILSARRQSHGGEAGWFSVRPSTLELSDYFSVHEQIAAQVSATRAIIDRDLGGLPQATVQTYAYKAICDDPKGWLGLVASRYEAATGIPIALRDAPTQKLSASRPRAENADQRLLDAALARFEGAFPAS